MLRELYKIKEKVQYSSLDFNNNDGFYWFVFGVERLDKFHKPIDIWIRNNLDRLNITYTITSYYSKHFSTTLYMYKVYF